MCSNRWNGWPAALVAALVCLVALSGCGDDEAEAEQSATLQAILEFTEAGPFGETAQLSSFTTFDWDAVYFIEPYTDLALVEQAIGQDVDVVDNSGFGQLVFLLDGSIVTVERALPPLNLVGDAGTPLNDAEATVQVATPDPGPYSSARIGAGDS
jgi:hypothetical protein